MVAVSNCRGRPPAGSQLCLTRVDCHTILEWTCWVCGKIPSALERERARAHQIGETETEPGIRNRVGSTGIKSLGCTTRPRTLLVGLLRMIALLRLDCRNGRSPESED